ncbi:MAG: 4Fe-4S dicluster domain-containing protein [Magnetococcales bacterium]|nr:4Fe-4S dicluster domain-containing protein [Magnetococcales bacterium]
MAYDLSFAREVYQHVEEGHWIQMCMQCGVCSGSCPLGPHWEFGPRQIFQMVRAGKGEQIMRSSALWMCTSCYNCIVRCPRHLPITHIIHGLARYSIVKGYVDPQQTTARFAGGIFWNNVISTGRVGEAALSMVLYFADGFGQGINNVLEMKNVALGMLKTKRLKPLPFRGKIKGYEGFKKMLDKAEELEMEGVEL